MMFNMGKNNAKVYVKSSNGITFDDVEGVDELAQFLYVNETISGDEFMEIFKII